MTFRTMVATSLVCAASLSPHFAPAVAAAVQQSAAQPSGPRADHHQHMLSPEVAAFLEKVEGGGVAKTIELPADVRSLLKQRVAMWDNAEGLAKLYAEGGIVMFDGVHSGRAAATEFLARRFSRAYDITPFAFSSDESTGRIAGYITRGQGTEAKHIAFTLITLAKGVDKSWRIASEAIQIPGPTANSLVDAAALATLLDQAEIQRGVVMSVGYLFENGLGIAVEDARAKLQAENDWTAAQVARMPDRLIAFCGVNPLTDYAVQEVERCARQLKMNGIKLHFGNSRVDLKKPDHLAKIRSFFQAANRLKLPVAAHLWNGLPDYGHRDSEIFLNEVLPMAPAITVQVMHMAGAGPGWADEALEVFAQAVEAGDSRAKNLLFDVATVATSQPHPQLVLLAKRIRQIGPKRILYGSDGSFGGRNTPDQEWGNFRGMVPLTDAEFEIIRTNVAPYLRRRGPAGQARGAP